MALGKWRVAAIAAALIAIAFGALWYFESPAWTLKGMKDAAQSHDADALSAYVDYPALRQSLKAELKPRMTAEARKHFGALGAAFDSVVMSPVIDRLISPAGMRAALLATSLETASPAASALHVPKEPVIVRRNFSEFIVTAKNQPNRGLVFKRHGLSWMLSGVELPPDSSTPAR